MAEERLIDDDKDRKYKIRKNADGEDELYIDDTPDEEDDVIMPVFAVPYDDEDDDEAVSLTPEQFAERERIKQEEREAREKRLLPSWRTRRKSLQSPTSRARCTPRLRRRKPTKNAAKPTA